MRGAPAASILSAVADYYDAKLAEHGATPRGVDWRDRETHALRHAQFWRLLEGEPEASVIDLGCGYGDFLTMLRDRGHRGRYLGCDIAPGMIAAARRLHGEGADRAWEVGAAPTRSADYAIASGIMNVRRGADEDDWRRYVETLIATLARCSTRGFGFNMLSLYSDADKRRADLHYADPVGIFADCLRLYGRHVAILQDYGLWEFTVLVRHTSGPSS